MTNEEKVLAAFDENIINEMTRITTDLININCPTGREGPVGEYVADLFSGLGLSVSSQEVEAGRNNIIAVQKGAGRGKTLAFNAHFDISVTSDQKEMGDASSADAKVKDGWIYGVGASNMKSAFACYYGAIKAIRKAGIELPGDIIVTGVVGEIEKGPVDEYQGIEFRGGGCGSLYLCQHGLTADMCIIGEPTGTRLQIGTTGMIFAKISATGTAQHTWSKENGEDAIEKMIIIREELKRWESVFEAKHVHPYMKPRIGIGAIKGGYPYKPSICPAPYCNLYIDIRPLPGQKMHEVKREFEDFLDGIKAKYPAIDAKIEFFLTRKGYEETRDEAVVKIVDEAHRSVYGSDVIYTEGYRSAVTADTAIFHEFGIPAVTYGPGGILRNGLYSMYDGKFGECVGIGNITKVAEVYALAALKICS